MARRANPPARGLTQREQSILDCLDRGLNQNQAAKELGISRQMVWTVKERLNARGRAASEASCVSET